MQPAETDFKQAEFYRRTDHPGPAYFYHSLVVRTYPGTPYAQESARILKELEAARDKEHAAQPAQTAPAPARPQPAPPAPSGPAGPDPAPSPPSLPPRPPPRARRAHGRLQRQL